MLEQHWVLNLVRWKENKLVILLELDLVQQMVSMKVNLMETLKELKMGQLLVR